MTTMPGNTGVGSEPGGGKHDWIRFIAAMTPVFK
jgi:hypothetical protein